jgi:hypothetical protein
VWVLYGQGRGGEKIGSVLFLISAVLTVVVWAGMGGDGSGNLGFDHLGGYLGFLGVANYL